MICFVFARHNYCSEVLAFCLAPQTPGGGGASLACAGALVLTFVPLCPLCNKKSSLPAKGLLILEKPLP